MAVQQRTSGVLARIQSLLNGIISPETRERYWNKIGTFAQEQPLLLTFGLAQLIFSFLPLALFASFVLGTLLLSVISAILFSLFWTGVALLLLVPTLFVTVSLGFIFWVWAISSFLVAKWTYDMMPVSVRGTTEVGLPNGKKFVVDKGEGKGDFKGEMRDGA
ncbi:uncharacterized protein LY89DRAFT_638534 [Mollisia scopiformis]|uniref:Uncharacterized protein n=1 Tax=Mollisia scopiformis TaxID=149040 RepID=A0A194XM87_MOLSC|nr:uncharacterized protein LY89DRAFT_638534 [Mollisia scopiformis]KUJ20882.1 hypothetical protein LY89DRAFT_638534 [Mollisia scopiformis]